MKTVVILHGWGQSSDHWRDAFPAGDFAVRMIDMPGFGSEPIVNRAWGVPEYAAWVRERLEREGVEDVVLLGHSFGGRVAAEIAVQRPAWLKGLILYGAPCLYRPTPSVSIKRKVAKLARMIGLGGRYRGNPELNEADRRGLGEIYRRVVNFDQTNSLRQIRVPTLLLWGADDRDVPLRIAQEMQRFIPRAQLQVLPGLGHNAHLENPSLFFGVVKKYVEDI